MTTHVLTEHEGTCRSCGAPVYWAETEKGKRMPVDREPRNDGNIALLVVADIFGETRLTASYRKKGEVPQGRFRYVSHFATCSHSASWRRG